MHYQEIDETPQIIGALDWNLADRQANAIRARSIAQHRPEVLEDFGFAQLVRLVGDHGGQYALISTRDGLLEYYMHYEVNVLAGLGRSATQIKLWRKRTATVQGLASKVFGQYLLPGFDSIISDAQQTPRGREFWEVQISAYCHSKTVGLLIGDQIKIYNPRLAIDDWLASVRAAQFKRMRFFITPYAVRPLPSGGGYKAFYCIAVPTCQCSCFVPAYSHGFRAHPSSWTSTTCPSSSVACRPTRGGPGAT